MAANTAAIWVLAPNTAWAAGITGGNTATDGTGTVSTVLTAGVNGAYVRRLKVKALGSNVASVLRVFVNNGSTNATPANNTLIAELQLPLSTASNNAAIGPDYELPLNLLLDPGHKINVCLGTAVAAGYSVLCEGGDY